MAKLTSGPGWSLSDATSASVIKKENPAAPRPVIRLEKRAGKSVTVVSGLHTYGSARLNGMAREWKTLWGVGGTVKDSIIEIQGDQVTAIRKWFLTTPKSK